jgi:DNA topoisomerase-1
MGSYDERHYYEGISRELIDNKYEYFYIDNKKTVNQKDLDRINKLGIPPAWTDVWISRDPNASIQVIGKDIKGRKQYRYHQVHIVKAEEEKFLRLLKFIRAMPKLEKVIEVHQRLPIYNKYKVISLMLILVKELHLRVGKEVYARTNKSYGISSLRKKHVKISSTTHAKTRSIYFRFKGKSNKRLQYTINDPDIIQQIKLLLKLDGDWLFQYTTDDLSNEKISHVTDTDLNTYIQEHMGKEFTMKDFRTYAANFYFIKTLLNETLKHTPKTRSQIKKNIVNALKSTAYQLKHTKAISKKSYVMHFAMELYQNDPEYFISRKNDNPDTVMLDLLKLYKKHVIQS